MAWATWHEAPRDRPVWLYLPALSFKADEHGRPTEVTPGAVVAQWDQKRGAWISRDGHPVYPSMWSDADVAGPMPDNPMIELKS